MDAIDEEVEAPDENNLDENSENNDTEDGSLTEGHAHTKTRYNLRPNRAPSYSHRLSHQMDEPENPQSYGSGFLQQSKIEDTQPSLIDQRCHEPRNWYYYDANVC
jgi:hypothetical protein